jgi:LAO/AO transport system kinase
MIDLAQALLDGNRRALARALTLVENESEKSEPLLAALFPHTGRAWVIGITGAPGTGKSTLVNEVAKAYRKLGKSVGIIAVDPTSPFSGGAILGDRIRMRDLSGDPGIFIRSMATRGNLGGLARATRDAIRVFDAAKFDLVLVETVGAGQNEVDIVRAAHTTIVVEAPGLGDEVQAIKAGILEIADVLVVNKADRQGAAHTIHALKAMLEMGHPSSRAGMLNHHGRVMQIENGTPADAALWIPPIVQTIAAEGKGTDVLIAAVESHRQHLEAHHELAQIERQHLRTELYDRLRDSLMARLLQTLPPERIAGLVERIQAREIDPQSAVQALLSGN